MKFMAHDFFTEQPVVGADVYYFRWILHDWSDKYCTRILKALIPALKPGARIVLSERCLEPPCTVSHAQEKWNRCVISLSGCFRMIVLTFGSRDSDITMMAVNNSQERDQEDWEELFRNVDSRLKIEEIKRMKGAKLDLIVVRWV